MVNRITVEQSEIKLIHDNGESDDYTRDSGGQTWTYEPASPTASVETLASNDVANKVVEALNNLGNLGIQFSVSSPTAAEEKAHSGF